MTEKQARKLNNGLYRLEWKARGYSLAAVGRLNDGSVWFAPCNWVSITEAGIACTKWHWVKSAKRLVVEN